MNEDTILEVYEEDGRQSVYIHKIKIVGEDQSIDRKPVSAWTVDSEQIARVLEQIGYSVVRPERKKNV